MSCDTACDTGSVFSIAKPDSEFIKRRLREAAGLDPACPDLLDFAAGLKSPHLPWGFSHDVSRSEVGAGESAFVQAKEAFANWREFDLGWVRVANPEVPISLGEVVAVEAHTAGLW